MSGLSDCHNISDLRSLGKKRIPGTIFDYIDGGAEDEVTLRRNRDSFNKYEFVPRVLRDVREIDLSTTVQGVDIDLPLLSAPTGMSRMFHHKGERAVVKATHQHGTAYCLSTVSTCSIEEVRETSPGPLFFQIYAWRDQAIVDDFIERCKKSKYAGLMLAVDVPVLGKRERDLRHGHGTSKLRRNTALAALSKPAWLFNYLTSPAWRMANLVNHLPHGAKTTEVIDDVNNQFDASVTWDDAAKMLKAWGGPFVLKGVQSVEDSIKAVALGASGIILSNHGGRQLDGAPTGFDILPEVVEAVGSKTEIIIDGGIQRGSDVIKAIALGASACLIGKPYLYGLAAGGEKGVYRAYEILKSEMIRVMQLIGCTSIRDLDKSYIKKID